MSATIFSSRNPRLKQAAALRRRSQRNKTGLMLIEGCRELRCALAGGHPVRELFFCPELFCGPDGPGLVADCERRGAELFPCAAGAFAKVSYRDRPDGVLAVAPQARRRLEDLSPREPALVVVVQAVEKPGNLGSILRSADAAGVDALLLCDRCTDVSNPNVVRSSLGTLFTVPVAEAASRDAVAWLRGRRIRILAATPRARVFYTDADMAGPTAIVLGAEQTGLGNAWLAQADQQVAIPMRGRADSLNVAAAAAVLLYEALRQRPVVKPRATVSG